MRVLAAFSYSGHILVYAPQIFVILRTVAVLASFGYLGHILVYAPQTILNRRLATVRII